jgi:hypothetical protein
MRSDVADRSGIPAAALSNHELSRELASLHRTRHDAGWRGGPAGRARVSRHTWSWASVIDDALLLFLLADKWSVVSQVGPLGSAA